MFTKIFYIEQLLMHYIWIKSRKMYEDSFETLKNEYSL